VLAVTALGWLTTAIVFAEPSGSMHSDGNSMGMAMGAASHGQSMSHMSTHISSGSLPGFLGMWLLMLTAMMSPVLIAPLRHLGSRSLAGHRFAARVLFVAAYAVVWSLAGVGLLMVADVLDRLGAAAAVAVSVAMIWQLSPVKQRCLNGHHARPPLAAFGWRAELAALRFGAQLGAWCVGSCWTLMLLPLVLTTHQLTAMVAVTLWIWAEQLEFPALARWRIRVPTRAILVARAATSPRSVLRLGQILR
jgi:predicted metal-binding membrane protein